MQVNDPLNQLAIGYQPGGDNQPLQRNIGLALEHQARLGRSDLSGRMFTPEMKRFILGRLYEVDRDMGKFVVIWIRLVSLVTLVIIHPHW